MIPLEPDDIRSSHDVVLSRYGGIPGEKDPGMIDYIAEKPFQIVFGVDQYPGIFDKAAVYMHTIATLHCFNDANKRTAVNCATIFLAFNGYSLIIRDTLLFTISVNVAKKRLSIERLAAILQRNSRRISEYFVEDAY